MAILVERAEDWRWGSLRRRMWGSPEDRSLLSTGPLPLPADWTTHVNRPQTEAEFKAVRASIQRGSPFGSGDWEVRTASRLSLDWTLRHRGRPRTHA